MSQSPLRRQPIESLATKIILFVFVSTFATALTVSWISIQSTHSYLTGMIDQQFPATLIRARNAVQTWIAAGAGELQQLAKAGDRLDEAALREALAQSTRFEGLALITTAGKLKRAVGRVGGGPTWEQADFGGAPDLGLRAIVTPTSAAATVYAARWGPADRPLGLIIGAFRPVGIQRLLKSLETGLGEAVLLVDGKGRVAHGAAGTSETIPVTELHAPGGAPIVDYVNAAGTHVLGSAMPLGLADWYVAVESPFDVAFAPVVSVVKRIFVIDLCIILLFSFLAYKVTAAIVKPIETLSDGARRIAQGQLDLEIPEPSTHDEIGLLTRTFNDMMRKLRRNQMQIETTNTELMDRNNQLRQANEVLEQLSITDGLTKLHNHRFFQDHLTREIKRVQRVNKPLSMIIADIDDFKALNDRLGHAAGDELLRRIARLMNESIRDSDLLARYGGEEFVVLTSDTDLKGAERLAEKIRVAIAESSFILDESLRPTRTTVSMGVAQYKGNRKRFFAAADRSLYRAKAAGKNCVVVDDGQPG